MEFQVVSKASISSPRILSGGTEGSIPSSDGF